MPRQSSTFDKTGISLNMEALETDEADQLKRKLGRVDPADGFNDGKVGDDDVEPDSEDDLVSYNGPGSSVTELRSSKTLPDGNGKELY